MQKTTDILILGAGIAGYEAFRSLNKSVKKKITLIDRNNYFTFTPMLHEVATGSVLPNHAAIPIRHCLYKTPHEFWHTKVVKIHPQEKIVETTHGKIRYKELVIALGSRMNFFDIPGAKKYTHHVRTLNAAMKLHEKLISTLENSNLKKIVITIVGGGATGVELAGQLQHLADKDIKNLYPNKQLKIVLVQSSDRLMKYSHEKLQNMVEKKLRKSGVKILLKRKVVEVSEKEVHFREGKKLQSDITVWTAGFRNIGPDFISPKYCKDNRVLVNKYLQSSINNCIYAIGDISYGFPQLGEAAHKQGQHVAKVIAAKLKKKKLKTFKFSSKGQLIPIGDWYAVAHIGPLRFHGRFAWWLRRTVYLMFIPGLIRKLRIVFDWTLHGLGFRHTIGIDRET